MSFEFRFYMNPEDCDTAGTTEESIYHITIDTTDALLPTPIIVNSLPTGGGTYSYGWHLKYTIDPSGNVAPLDIYFSFGQSEDAAEGFTFLYCLCYGLIDENGLFTDTPTDLYIGQIYTSIDGFASYSLVIGGITGSGDSASYYELPASILTIYPTWYVGLTLLNGAIFTPNPSGIFNTADQAIGDITIAYDNFSGTPTYVLVQYTNTVPCFLEGSQILCLVDEKENYLPIEKMRKGTLVKTLNSGYKMVHIIGKRDILNFNDSKRIKDRLYKLTSAKYPALTSDLYLTGCHSTLVDSLTEEQKDEIKKMLGVVCVTERKYRLPACIDNNAEPWQSNGTYTVWHFALDDQNPLINFGVYANGGLIVETGSIRYLQEKANMELV